jgi:hypothetical protein
VREWWIRTGLVLQAPRAVFVALRDDSAEAAADRAEPVLAIVILAGVALAFASHAAAGYHGLLLAVWLFVAGGITGAAAYWFFGAVLYAAVRALGSLGSYRRSRHLLAFACVPLAVSLVVSPAGHDVYRMAAYVVVAWSAALLVTGVRAVHGWSWARSALAAAAPVAAAALLLAL